MKLSKPLSTLLDCLCLDAIQPLNDTRQRISKSSLFARKEWRAGSRGYIPARSGSECGCCVLISPSKEKTSQLIGTETNQLYLLFFPTVPPGFFLDFEKKNTKTKHKTMKFIHLWKRKKEFYNNPIQSYQLCLITAYSGVDLKKNTKLQKLHWQDSWTWCKTLVFCVECRTTLV